MDRDHAVGGIIGLCVGDALGLPVEYRSRSYLRGDPVTEMFGFGTHNQPPGTWSTNVSLALCTVESLSQGFSLPDVAARYVMFLRDGHWTPAGEHVDLASQVQERIEYLSRSDSGRPVEPEAGSPAYSVLSRTLPLAGALGGLSAEERFKRVTRVAALTNGSMQAVLGSFLLVETAIELAAGHPPAEAYRRTQARITRQLRAEPALDSFARVLKADVSTLSEDDIHTEGEVVHAVEASLWCLLTNRDYRSAVLTAVNLGGATHLTASLTGGLAGYAYGIGAIPENWVETLVRRAEILGVAERLFQQAAARR